MAFQALFERHAGHMLGYAQKYLKSLERAEEITQEIWMKVIKLSPSYNGQGHFTAWVYTLIRNQCLNTLRSEKRLVHISDSELSGDIPDSHSFENEILEQKDVERVKKAIENLPDTQRVALLLYAVEGLSYEDIANELNTSVSAIKSLIFRARIKLAGSR